MNFVGRVPLCSSAEATAARGRGWGCIFTPMHSFNDAFYELKNKLQPFYDEREAVAMAHEVVSYITGLDKMERLLEKETLFTQEQQKEYDRAMAELLKCRPLQYVIGKAWFMGREYLVNENVLIPRPETEELVEWIIGNLKVKSEKLQVLDVGAGSGCIPISLKLVMTDADITSVDISEGALGVAGENAQRLEADIQFKQLDFLDQDERNKLGIYDVIVSNPPYIPDTEQEAIHANVKDHEPHIALFVPGNDALLFYKAIAEFGIKHLKSNGYIYCELEAGRALECKDLFENNGYSVEIRKDMHGNWRMLKAGVIEPQKR